jgi:hypothetical protein
MNETRQEGKDQILPKAALALCRSVALLLVATLFSCMNVVAMAQESGADKASTTSSQSVQRPDTDKQETEKAKEKEEKEKEKAKKKPGKLAGLVVAPLPISSPAVGSGIIPVLGYIFPFSSKDKVSPPSTVGVAGLITNNGSRGFGIGGQLFLKEDTYEITAGFVHGNINYNIYGNGPAAGLKLPLTIKVDALAGFRYWHFGQNLSFTTNSLNFSGSQDWVDPLVGGRILGNLSPKIEVAIGGDVGGWGAGSQLDYTIGGFLGYRIKPAVALQAGYRYLSVNYRNGARSRIADLNISGPVIGATITLK